MLVRAAAALDAMAICEIKIAAWRAAYAEYMPSEYLESLRPEHGLKRMEEALQDADSPFRVKVVESGGRVLGYAILGAPRYSTATGTLELWALNVQPEHWRKGAGRMLVIETLKNAREKNLKRVSLWCIAGNLRARALYEACGFELTGASRVNSEVASHPLSEVEYHNAA